MDPPDISWAPGQIENWGIDKEAVLTAFENQYEARRHGGSRPDTSMWCKKRHGTWASKSSKYPLVELSYIAAHGAAEAGASKG
eukprot:7462044-Karenia_brevis.AAC.1